MNKIIFCFIFMSLSNVSLGNIQKWQLNDVSYLMALPTADEGQDFLLRAYDKDQKGALFPVLHEEEIRNLVVSLDRPEPNDPYTSLSVVGMRIDPCFRFTDSMLERCHPQVRLVWQPTAGFGTKDARTFDAALHTFYDLTEAEFETLTEKLQLLKEKNLKLGVTTDNAPLGIHPAYFNQKTRQAFNKELNSLILSVSGTTNLVRFTFMKLMAKDFWWSFGGKDKNEYGDWYPTVIPRVREDQTNQDFFNEDRVNPMGIKGSIVPVLEAPKDNLSSLAKGFGMLQDERSQNMIKNGVISINRLENPTLESPATIDCVSCHIAEPTRRFVDWKYPEMALAAQSDESRFQSPNGASYNLKNVNLMDSLTSIRAFGYFGNRPSINQRMINETVEVADKLNEK